MKPIPRLSASDVPFQPVADARSAAPDCLAFARFRGSGHKFMLRAEAGDSVTFRVRYMQVAQYAGRPIPITVVAPAGLEACQAEALFQQDTDISFEAPETGTYRMQFSPGPNYMHFVSTTHPFILNGEDAPVGFYSSVGPSNFRGPRTRWALMHL